MKSRRVLALLAMLVASVTGCSQTGQREAEARLPIIDMHLHALPANAWGAPGTPVCPGYRENIFLGYDPRDRLSGERLNSCSNPLLGALTDEQLKQESLAALERYNIVKAVTSGPLIEQYRAAPPDRILASPLMTDATIPASALREAYGTGKYQALAEFAPQYAGLAPNDPALEPYFALAEELDIPLGIHVGLGPPGAPYVGSPKYRMRLSNPLLLEDVLTLHPKLRLYVMHAGWPMLNEIVGLLYAHPQVYVDVSVINWYLPRLEFYAYLRRLVEAGFGKRILFGSDQMVWPEAIGIAIESIQSASFLTEEQKRDIFFNNAARFLRLDENQRSQ